MKSFSFAKALVVTSLLGLVLPVACGDSEENPKPSPSDGGESSGGAPSGTAGEPAEPVGGGAAMDIPGTSPMSETLECDAEPMCESVSTISPTLFINPCCTDGGACGVSTEFLAAFGGTFEEVCQAKGQEGEADEACPTTEVQMIPVMGTMLPVPGFEGCCRAATGTCGVLVNAVGMPPLVLADFGLGCVDSAPFFMNEPGAPCGEGAVGGAGGSGAGGAPAAPGGDGAGGASGGAGGAN